MQSEVVDLIQISTGLLNIVFIDIYDIYLLHLSALLANLRGLSTARAGYPGKITKNITFPRFHGFSVEIIEEKNREKVIHSQFNSPCSNPETRDFGRTQVVQINI